MRLVKMTRSSVGAPHGLSSTGLRDRGVIGAEEMDLNIGVEEVSNSVKKIMMLIQFSSLPLVGIDSTSGHFLMMIPTGGKQRRATRIEMGDMRSGDFPAMMSMTPHQSLGNSRQNLLIEWPLV